MKHLGWKIAFGVSWIPALFLYGTLIAFLAAMGHPGVGYTLVGGIGVFALLIPCILFAILQVFLGWAAFR